VKEGGGGVNVLYGGKEETENGLGLKTTDTEREWKGEERKGLGLCKKPKFPFKRCKKTCQFFTRCAAPPGSLQNWPRLTT